MRTSSLHAIALLFLCLTGGCLEYETTTTIRPDGSFVRTVVIKGDSSSIHGARFRVPVDSTWKVLDQSKVDDRKWTLTIERMFASDEEWHSFQSALRNRTLISEISVDKSFRFFTTTYTYSETIKRFNPFTKIPITDYLSPYELDAYLRFEVNKESYPTRGDSLANEDAGDRFEAWEAETRFASYFDALLDGLRADSRLRSDAARVAEARERLHAGYLRMLEEGKRNFNPEESTLLKWVRSANEPEIVQALSRQKEVFAGLKDDADFVKAVLEDSYKSSISMPGEILSSNSSKSEDGKPTWNDYIVYAYVNDFTMRSESREVNVAFILLALAVIVAVPMLVLVAKGVRNRRTRTKVVGV